MNLCTHLSNTACSSQLLQTKSNHKSTYSGRGRTSHISQKQAASRSQGSAVCLCLYLMCFIYIYVYTHTHIYMSVSVEVCFGYVSMALEASEASCNNYISNAFWGYVPMPEAADTKRFAYAEARDLRPKTLEPEAKNARTHHLPNKKNARSRACQMHPKPDSAYFRSNSQKTLF